MEAHQSTTANQLWEWGREHQFPDMVGSLNGIHRTFAGWSGWGGFVWFATEKELADVLAECEAEGADGEV